MSHASGEVAACEVMAGGDVRRSGNAGRELSLENVGMLVAVRDDQRTIAGA